MQIHRGLHHSKLFHCSSPGKMGAFLSHSSGRATCFSPTFIGPTTCTVFTYGYNRCWDGRYQDVLHRQFLVTGSLSILISSTKTTPRLVIYLVQQATWSSDKRLDRALQFKQTWNAKIFHACFSPFSLRKTQAATLPFAAPHLVYLRYFSRWPDITDMFFICKIIVSFSPISDPAKKVVNLLLAITIDKTTNFPCLFWITGWIHIHQVWPNP